MQEFPSIFCKTDSPQARGKYLSRVFGIFSEEIVRIWASDPNCPYEDLGRPTLRNLQDNLGSTLDFALRHKSTGKLYVTELKCEIEYQNYRYLILSNISQLNHHKKPAFLALLEVAGENSKQQIYLNGKLVLTDGAILIWGAATPVGRLAVIEAHGFFDVLTIEGIIKDLKYWENKPYQLLIDQRRLWTNEMFNALQ